MIRVWIETGSTIARAGFESVLEGSADIEVTDSPSQADVILREGLPDLAEENGLAGVTGVTPTVILAEAALTLRLVRRGICAILPRHAAAEQIVAALHAASAGLIAIPVETSTSILPEAAEFEAENLTPREMETLEMLAEGLSNKQIAAQLYISEHTAKFHVNSILGKLHAGTRTEAVIRAIRTGLLKV